MYAIVSQTCLTLGFTSCGSSSGDTDPLGLGSSRNHHCCQCPRWILSSSKLGFSRMCQLSKTYKMPLKCEMKKLLCCDKTISHLFHATFWFLILQLLHYNSDSEPSFTSSLITKAMSSMAAWRITQPWRDLLLYSMESLSGSSWWFLANQPRSKGQKSSQSLSMLPRYVLDQSS